MSALSVAVVGLGYWGPNLARNFAENPDFDLVALCDTSPSRLERVGRTYPAARRYADLAALLAVTVPDLVAIATPVGTHGALGRLALRAGSHVLLEKPLAATVADAEELVKEAGRVGRRLFVDHTFLFTGAVREILRQTASGSLGELLYLDSVRINLGLFQSDIDVVWDLAPHDLSILHAVVGRLPKAVSARGTSHNPRGLADVAYLHLDYDGALSAHAHVSWLSPVKVRRMFLAGTRRSLIYDDLDVDARVKIYDHAVEFDVKDLEARREVLVSYRRGEMRVPAVSLTEALSVEVAELARALRDGGGTVATGEDGLAVVKILEAASESLRRSGEAVALSG